MIISTVVTSLVPLDSIEIEMLEVYWLPWSLLRRLDLIDKLADREGLLGIVVCDVLVDFVHWYI